MFYNLGPRTHILFKQFVMNFDCEISGLLTFLSHLFKQSKALRCIGSFAGCGVGVGVGVGVGIYSAALFLLRFSVGSNLKEKNQGPVVQSIVSLTSSLRDQLVRCFMTL